MALAIQQAASWTPGLTVTTIACDNSYPTGGYPLTQTDLRFPNDAPDTVFASERKGFAFDYDKANQKLQVFQGAAGAGADIEVTGGTDLSAVTGVRVIALGHPT